MDAQVAEWKHRFDLAGVAEIVDGEGGLAKIVVTAPEASAEVYLHGAQVTSWRPAGAEEVLFLSERSRWEDGRAIRGGIPVCFPWFRDKADDPAAPAHGFVRTRAWRLEGMAYEAGEVVLTLATASDASTRKWWPYEFRLEHRIAVGAALGLRLTVTNTGSTPWRFEEALHTYHRVGDATMVTVAGLEGQPYLDNMDGNREKTQEGEIAFTRQTDNAYLGTEHALAVKDPVLGRQITTEKENARTTVAWNPWKEGAGALADLGDEAWQRMVCVEAANMRSDAVWLEAGQEHAMQATLKVEALSSSAA
ncbi:MAG TPA: D-hexose-6-phosphate mutarotase [Acidobacteriaceae bacterium]